MRRVAFLIPLIALANCRDGHDPGAGGADAGRADGAPGPEVPPPPLDVDFTVSGCPQSTAGPRCTGRAPLTIELVPIATGGATRFVWDFGDGTPRSSERTPRHTYALPGSYAVTLVAGVGASAASQTRSDFVVVTRNSAGEACDVDAQCQVGLRCVCGSAEQCPAAFARGICAASCADDFCATVEVCANLTGSGQGRSEPWQRPLCLRACMADADCGPWLRCRDLPDREGNWVRGCFAEHPLPVGVSCRNATGQLRDEVCVTRACADMGANGVCTMDCDGAACPPGSACADIADGRSICLRACGLGFACDTDPLLTCVRENRGPLGFALRVAAAPASYCGPRPCASSADCGPTGQCRINAEGAHCMRRD